MKYFKRSIKLQDTFLYCCLPKDRLDQIETADQDISKVNFTIYLGRN